MFQNIKTLESRLLTILVSALIIAKALTPLYFNLVIAWHKAQGLSPVLTQPLVICTASGFQYFAEDKTDHNSTKLKAHCPWCSFFHHYAITPASAELKSKIELLAIRYGTPPQQLASSQNNYQHTQPRAPPLV